jgi:ABC-type Zn2+ transport system substrate-binding protein/surface adhesin
MVFAGSLIAPMKKHEPLPNGNSNRDRPVGPGVERNLNHPCNATAGRILTRGLKQALLVLIMAGVACVSFPGCIWVHEHREHGHEWHHDHDFDHDRGLDHDHFDHHDDRP